MKAKGIYWGIEYFTDYYYYLTSHWRLVIFLLQFSPQPADSKLTLGFKKQVNILAASAIILLSGITNVLVISHSNLEFDLKLFDSVVLLL